MSNLTTIQRSARLLTTDELDHELAMYAHGTPQWGEMRDMLNARISYHDAIDHMAHSDSARLWESAHIARQPWQSATADLPTGALVIGAGIGVGIARADLPGVSAEISRGPDGSVRVVVEVADYIDVVTVDCEAYRHEFVIGSGPTPFVCGYDNGARTEPCDAPAPNDASYCREHETARHAAIRDAIGPIGSGVGIGILPGTLAPAGIDWQAVRADRRFGLLVANEYDRAPSYDAAPMVRHAYDLFACEVEGQFRSLAYEYGVTVSVTDGDPYPDAFAMFDDVTDNGHLAVLSSAATGGHPYLTDAQNDMFRAVHDFFGHYATGRTFTRHGEEAAFLAHSRMFSPWARRAMTVETRGQNSVFIWKNNGEVFPEQKLCLLPAYCTDARQHAYDVPELLVGAGAGVGIVNPNRPVVKSRVSMKPADVLARNFDTTVRKTVARILSWFDASSDEELLAGLGWYAVANGHAHGMASTYGITPEQAAAVIAHLSPQLGWDENLAAAYALLKTGTAHAVLGTSIERAKVAMLADNPTDTFGPDADKTYSFYANILGAPDPVTVDRHAVRVAVGAYDVDTQRRFARVGSYDAIAHCYRIAARRRGVSPADMQAVAWVVCRATLSPKSS